MNTPPINTKAGKRQFIRNFCNSVRDSLLKAVPNMPDEWDGHELRELVAREFNWEADGNLLRRDRKRMRAFDTARVSRGIR